MPITTFAVEIDLFEPEDNPTGFSFPCCSCKHRSKDQFDYPCISCDHNENCTRDDDAQTG